MELEEVPLETRDNPKSFRKIYIFLLILLMLVIIGFTFFMFYPNPVKSLNLRVQYDIPLPKIRKVEQKVKTESLYDYEFPVYEADIEKQTEVKNAFLHSWNNYKNKCWGRDAINPITGQCLNIFSGGLFIVDSIDTLWVMGLKDEFKESEKYFKSYKFNGSWSLFETIIRYVGGLISAYEISGSPTYYRLMKEIGYYILPIINDETGFYSGRISINNGHSSGSGTYGNLAEVGTYQLEFMKLSEHLDDPAFIQKAMKVYKTLWSKNPNTGLINGVHSSPGTVYFGASYDSYFEYIPKAYALCNGTAKGFLDRHLMTIDEIEKTCVYDTAKGTKLIGNTYHGSKAHTIEHLATFLPGTIALGTFKEDKRKKEHLELAESVVQSYANIFRSTMSKLMPETVRIDTHDLKFDSYNIQNDEYLLRPETAESIYYMYRFTGKQMYRDMAWDLFKGINISTREKYGFSNVKMLNSTNVIKTGTQESYFLAETLKYLYLIFSDSEVYDPTKLVFNTEAHIFKIWNQTTIDKFGKYMRLSSDGSYINYPDPQVNK